MWGMITTIFKLAMDYVHLKKAQQDAAIEAHKAVATERMTGEITQNTLQLAQLYSFKDDSYLRLADFFILLLPYIVCVFAPDAVNHYFKNVAHAIPQWFQYVTLGAFYAIWGIGKVKSK